MSKAADEHTRQYLFKLMSQVPGELKELAEVLRTLSNLLHQRANRVRDDSDKLRFDSDQLMECVVKLRAIVNDLLDTTNKTVSIEPMMNMLEDDSEEKA